MSQSAEEVKAAPRSDDTAGTMIAVKRLFRITWMTISYASAILLLPTIALWVRSYSYEDTVTVVRRFGRSPSRLYAFQASGNWGHIYLSRETIAADVEWAWVNRPFRHSVTSASAPAAFIVHWYSHYR